MEYRELFGSFIEEAKTGSRVFKGDSGWKTPAVALAMAEALSEIDGLRSSMELERAVVRAKPGVDLLVREMTELCDRLEADAAKNPVYSLGAQNATTLAMQQIRSLLAPFRQDRSSQLESPGR